MRSRRPGCVDGAPAAQKELSSCFSRRVYRHAVPHRSRSHTSADMKISGLTFLRGAAWTIGAFGVGQALRLLTNIVLARLLAPELFGIMIIINSVRTGIDLVSDVGIGQSIVQNRNAEDP